MTTNSKQTSAKIATLASDTLKNQNASQIQKTLAASALAQSQSSKQTSAAVESTAAKVLQSEKYSETTKALAASVLSQSNKDR